MYANNVILAMPRRSLELLDQKNFFFKNPDLQVNMRSIIKEASMKILLGFDKPWWRKNMSPEDPLNGRCITDLPMRQCYYFGTDEKNQHSLMLASYNDMQTVKFWKALMPAPRYTKADEIYFPRETDHIKHQSLEEFMKKFQDNLTTKCMVKELMNQLKELHGNPNIPDPYVALVKDWGKDPYGAGYHSWKARYPVEDIAKFMRNPIKNESVFIVGEAYSFRQGWVEGAFSTAEKLLNKNFGLKRPSWIPEDYHLAA